MDPPESPPETPPENAPEDQPLTEQQLQDAGPIMEASGPRLLIPSRGKVFEEDGTCRVAIIRPCVSRGRRLGPQKLPPIYTPKMLAENASVFSGWLMYVDHLTEEMVEWKGRRIPLAEAIAGLLQERQRSVRELGGRVVASHYDPDLTFEDDEEFGYQRGGVVGRSLPRRMIREMLEDDPKLLHVSINAYPRGARPGRAPWDQAVRGMIVEGIRSKPQGTVDWVPRGGAGGRVLQELEVVLERLAEEPTVSSRRRSYASGDVDLRTASRDQLIEQLREENPDLARELGLEEGAQPPRLTFSKPTTAPGLTQEELDRRLAAQRDELLAESEAAVEDRAAELIEERERARELERVAHRLIQGSGLPSVYQADLLQRWSVRPSGPSAALAGIEPVMEGDRVRADKDGNPMDAEYVLRAAVGRDLKHAGELIEAAGGGPRVTGLGGGRAGAERRAKRSGGAFRDFLRESGDLEGVKPEEEDARLKEMLTEGVSD